MKKRIMLAMAVIMVLGSVKAAMAADELIDNEAMAENGYTKTLGSEQDFIQNTLLKKIQMQIELLKLSGSPLDPVQSNSDVISLGQALSRADSVLTELKHSFDESKARQLSAELQTAINSRTQK